MPIFIDYHQLPEGLTIRDVREAHKSDLEKQEKYGVKFLQYWVNEKASTVFCLIEGPNKQACVDCHLESHGNTPCNIQEVETGIVELMMGGDLPVDQHHMTLGANGQADSSLRIIMVAQCRDALKMDSSASTKDILIPTVRASAGRPVELTAGGALVAVFDAVVAAFECIGQINQKLVDLSSEGGDRTRFALYCGQPLTYQGGFFEQAIYRATVLHQIAESGQLVISNSLRYLMNPQLARSTNSKLKLLSELDEKFIVELFQLVEHNLDSSQLDIFFLTRHLGISRTQLYRRITRLTGETPNQLIRSIRMKKALNLIRNRAGNITYISQEVGYSNPSYFSRVFRETFGVAPSEV